MKKLNSETGKSFRQIGILTSIPMVLAGGPLLGYFVGNWVDERWDIAPYGKAALMVLFFLGSMREVIRMVREVSRMG